MSDQRRSSPGEAPTSGRSSRDACAARPGHPQHHDDSERLADQLVELVGWALESAPELLPPADRFYDWLARDARRRHEREAAPDEMARLAAAAARIRENVLARQVDVIRTNVEPSRMARTDALSMGMAIDAARRARCAPSLDLAVAAGTGRELWDVPCEEWVEVPTGLPDGRYVALSVAGDSMGPLLHPGDLILVELRKDLQRDRVIVARRPDEGYVVKRVGRVTAQRIELLSLNPDFAPVTIPRDERLIVGTVVLRWCTHEGQRGA